MSESDTKKETSAASAEPAVEETSSPAPPKSSPPSLPPSEPTAAGAASRISARFFSTLEDTFTELKETMLKTADATVLEDEELSDNQKRHASVRSWSKEQQTQLEDGMRENLGVELTPEVWDEIAHNVTGKSGIECMDRYNFVLRMLAKRKANRPPPPRSSAAELHELPRQSGFSQILSNFFSTTMARDSKAPPNITAASLPPVFDGSLEHTTHRPVREAFEATPDFSGPSVLPLEAPLADVVKALKHNGAEGGVLLWDEEGGHYSAQVTVAALLVLRFGAPEAEKAEHLLDEELNAPLAPLAVLPSLHSATVKDVLRAFFNSSTLCRVYVAEEGAIVRSVSRKQILDLLSAELPLTETLSQLPPRSSSLCMFGAEPLVSALRLMSLKQISAVPVVDAPGGSLLGVLALSQIEALGMEAAQAELMKPLSEFVAAHSNKELHVKPDTALHTVLELMTKHDVDQVFVLKDKSFQRVVSLRDVLHFLAKE